VQNHSGNVEIRQERVNEAGRPTSYSFTTPRYRLSDLLENVIPSREPTQDNTEQGMHTMKSQDVAAISTEVERVLKHHFPAADRDAIFRAVRGVAAKYGNESSSRFGSPAPSSSTAPEMRSPAPRTVRFLSPSSSEGTFSKFPNSQKYQNLDTRPPHTGLHSAIETNWDTQLQ
jgi:hypothetical protein